MAERSCCRRDVEAGGRRFGSGRPWASGAVELGPGQGILQGRGSGLALNAGVEIK